MQKTETTITINGQEIGMLYCNATETGYESITGGHVEIFLPLTHTDEDGKTVVDAPPQARTADYMALAMSAIVAYYAKRKQNPPVNSEYISYEMTPQERNTMLLALIELRNEWYHVPDAANEDDQQAHEQTESDAKNA